MSEIIDDLIVLGRAVPERLKNGRVTVCLGGWSQTRGFIRLYPTRLTMPIKRWDIIRVEVEQAEHDDRHESWKIVGSHQQWDDLYRHVEKVGEVKVPYEKRDIVVNNLSPCVRAINDAHDSLGLIWPREILEKSFQPNPQIDKPTQLLLLPQEVENIETWASVKRDFDKEPRLKYVCSECMTSRGYHDQKILEWGFFEWMRKNPKNVEQVWKNAKFDSDKHEIYLFVGNQANQRTSFIIISVLPILKLPEPPPWVQPSLI